MYETLLSRVEPNTYDGPPKQMTGLFMLGNKRLDVDINLLTGSVSSGISTIEDEPVKRIEGATTQLFQTAYSFMQNTATRFGRVLDYEFTTSDSNMRIWAKVHGSRIFNWDSFNDDGFHLTARKAIQPVGLRIRQPQAVRL